MSAKPHIVFYDDSCPLCDAEIEHYKKLKTVHDISWLGIDSSWDDIKQYGFSKQTLLKRIHAVHSDGTIVTGAAAFALIWNSLKYVESLDKSLQHYMVYYHSIMVNYQVVGIKKDYKLQYLIV